MSLSLVCARQSGLNVCYRVERIPTHIMDSPIWKENRSFYSFLKDANFSNDNSCFKRHSIIHPLLPLPPKEPDPKIRVGDVVKWILTSFLFVSIFEYIVQGSKICQLLKGKDPKSPFTKTHHSKGRVRIRNWTSPNSLPGHPPFLRSLYVSAIF